MQYFAHEEKAHDGMMWSDEESPSDNTKRERRAMVGVGRERMPGERQVETFQALLLA